MQFLDHGRILRNKMHPKYFKYKDSSLLMKKVNNLISYMEENGIELSSDSKIHINVKEHSDKKLPELLLEDLEKEPEEYSSGCFEFPPTLEFKLIYRNPAWIKEREELEAEYRKQHNDQKTSK